MKRIFRTLACTVLVGCCTLFVSSYGDTSVEEIAPSSGGVALSGGVSAGDGVLDNSPLPKNPDTNVIQHPFLITPVEPKTAPDSDMARMPESAQLPFQHPFLKKPHGAPKKNDAVFVSNDGVSLPSDASNKPNPLDE